MPEFRFPSTPREQQTLSLPVETLESLEQWAVEGTGLTAAAHVTDAENRTALVKNGWTDGWFLPGGAVETGESPAAAARREVREETGLTATIHDPLVVLEQTYTAVEGDEAWFSALYIVYSATAEGDIADSSRLGVADEEIRAARWFDSIPENLHDGELLRPYLVANLG